METDLTFVLFESFSSSAEFALSAFTVEFVFSFYWPVLYGYGPHILILCLFHFILF